MAKQAVLQVRMDSALKEQAEQLYRDLGTSFAEAVRIFARQSVLERALPFTVGVPSQERQTARIGIARGLYAIPDDIDAHNDEIADLFESGDTCRPS